MNELAAALFQNSPMPIGIARLSDGCLVEVNGAFEKLLGCSREEALGRSFVQLGFWTGPADYQRLVEEVSGGKRVVGVPTPFRRKGGELREMQMSAHVICVGAERYFAGIVAENTTIARLENALALSEATYRAVVETCQDGFWMLDENSRIIAVNDAYVRLSGYSREELLGLTPYDLEDCGDADAVRRHIAKIESDGTTHFSTWHRAKNGTRLCLEVIGSNFPSMGRAFVFIRDISERQRTSSALRESEARFRGTFEQAAVGMAHIARGGKWLRVNKKLCDMLGYSEAETATMTAQSVTHPDDVQDAVEQFGRLLAGEVSTCSFQKRYLHKSGRIVWANVTTTLARDECGAPMYFISVGEDITERKSIEQELTNLRKKIDNMTRFDVAGHTVAALAHELNQPLTAVSSFAEAALSLLRAGNPQPGKLKHALEKSAQQAQRAGKVVHDLLAFLRHGEVQREPVDLKDLTRKVVTQINAHGHEGIRFDLDLAPALPAVVANRLQIQKVLANLVENGIEAMHCAAGANAAITVTVRTNAESNMAQVTVIDTGPGIDAEILHRVFDTFFTTKPNGLGVGLAISRTIIESHGGKLWAESVPGAGASLHFTLPFAP
jgi:two-component system sensor kinase FixL